MSVQASRLVQELEVDSGWDAGVRILSVDSRIRNISVRKGVDRANVGGLFDFDFQMSESGRSHNSLTMKYDFNVGLASTGQACKVSGEAVVRLSALGPHSDLNALGEDFNNQMAVEIFRADYQTVYLMHTAMGMSPPSPWITQDVGMSGRGHEVASGPD